MSGVTCPMTGVTFHMSQKKVGQSSGAIWLRVCYQRFLPRLVFKSYHQTYLVGQTSWGSVSQERGYLV